MTIDTQSLILNTFNVLRVGQVITLYLRNGFAIRGEVDECDDGLVAVVTYMGKDPNDENVTRWERTEVHPSEVCAIGVTGPR